MAHDRVIGALASGDRAGRVFTDDEVRVAEACAHQAAVALENARLYREATQRRREAQELARVARLLTESLDVQAVTERIVQSLLPLVGARSSGLFLVQGDRSLRAVAWGGRARDHFEVGQVVPSGTGISGRALATGMPSWTPDLMTDPNVVLTDDLRQRVGAMARAYDADVAADHLRGLPHVRADRIGVVGFSHGGMTALRAVQRRTFSLLDWRAFQASVAFYPACEAIDPELVTPLLVLIGDKDDWTPASRCRDIEPILPPREHVSMVFYPNAYHGFDRELPPRSIMGTGKWRHLEYDGAAAKAAAQKTRAWLDRYLK
jgi:dienelactone hydrolase